jgi:cytochrome c oxidase subunit 2
MYSGASNFVNSVDTAFFIILGISLFFLVGITSTMVYFVIKYNKKKHPIAEDVKDNTKLEILWTVIPTMLVLLMFAYGWLGYRPMRTVPDNSIMIRATARMWSWSFEYPNGKTSDILIVPLNKPIVLDMKSEDVIHGLFIPSFRIKEDVVPGKKNTMWFIPQQTGVFDIFCSEFCGQNHSYMLSKVDVRPVDDYIKWFNASDSAKNALEPLGLQIIKKNGCTACHSIDGTKIVGPSFKGIYGINETVETGGTKRAVKVDADYLKKSILEPNADIVEGFNPMMPPYKDKLNQQEIDEIIKYIQSLK